MEIAKQFISVENLIKTDKLAFKAFDEVCLSIINNVTQGRIISL